MRSRFVMRTDQYVERQQVLLVLGSMSLVLIIVGLTTALWWPKTAAAPASAASLATALPPLQRTLFVPLEPIAPNTRLDASMFKAVLVDHKLVPAGALENMTEIVDQYAYTSLVPDYPLVASAIGPRKGSGGNLPTTIPANYRAITIDVNKRMNFSGLLQPGDRVDVQWLTTHEGRPKLFPLVSNAEVISAEKRTERTTRAEDFSLVTLLVTAHEANRIAFAMANGTLSLTLRGANIKGDDADTRPIDRTTIIPVSEKPAVIDEITGYVRLDSERYAVTRAGTLIKEKKEK
jgi:Flp pilus assembly protein CpaB